VSIGLTPTTAINGTEIRVPPKQSVDSPKVWTMLFEGDAQTAADKIFKDFLTAGERSQTPSITWTQISPEWQMPTQAPRPSPLSLPPSIPPNFGGEGGAGRGEGGEGLIAVDYNWNIEDLEALKRMSKQVHGAGGKFGVRLPLAEINTAFLDRPAWRLTPMGEWAIGKSTNQEDEATIHHSPLTTHHFIYCVLSDYGYYLTQAAKGLIEETAADLLIFERPFIGSEDSALKGCDAFGHEHYSRAESIGTLYRWLFEFADYLHREYPHLQLGITGTAYGVEQPDAACLAHFDLFFD
jgi:hypothetical protein